MIKNLDELAELAELANDNLSTKKLASMTA